MENIIGEEVRHPEFGHGVIKYQQTRIGVKFDCEEHIHTFDYPDAFMRCLVAESYELRAVLNQIPNWNRCRYCGLYYESTPSDSIIADYDDSDDIACEKCRQKMYKCGCCNECFFAPKIIKHDVDDGIPICNTCYHFDFLKIGTRFPIPYSELLQLGFSIDDIYEYISLLDELRSIGICEILSADYGKNNNHIKSNNYLPLKEMIYDKLKSLIQQKMKIEVPDFPVFIRFWLGQKHINGFRCINPCPSSVEQSIYSWQDRYERQLDVFYSIDTLRRIFETELFRSSIKAEKPNAIIKYLIKHNNSSASYVCVNEIVHIVSISKAKELEFECDSKINSFEDDIESFASTPIPQTQDELFKRAKMIETQLSDYKYYEEMSSNLFDSRRYFDKIHPSDLEFCTDNDILYLYKGNCIRCKRYSNHKIISATAMIKTEQKERVPINIEYCTECDKFLMPYSSFESYRKRYEFLIIKLQEVDADGDFPQEFYTSLKRSNNSPLKLAGYNVNAAQGLKTERRHQLLANIISDGVLPKYRVIEYLCYFISQGEYQDRMQNAVAKWKEDLEFVENYQIEEQPKQDIDYLSKY